ncbi:MAG: TIGR03936 family radical SAM-associated protein, partial [Treponema sp.]|jgi:radical SAM-linked protein|nr:TIGR03936 family radical SAM-associated protein [Treponema sp.]
MPDGGLPWDCIDSGVSSAYLRREYENSACFRTTEPCAEKCPHPCGICPGRGKIAENGNSGEDIPGPERIKQTAAEAPQRAGILAAQKNPADPETHRIIFSFTKEGSAVWLPHLSLIEVFSMTMLRAGIPALFTRGFNPLVKLDFASPLSIGITAEGEIAALDLERDFSAEEFTACVNRRFPSGMAVTKAVKLTIASGTKKHSAAALLWGYEYRSAGAAAKGAGAVDIVEAAREKEYRQGRLDAGESLSDLCRKAVLAKRPAAAVKTFQPETGLSYFAVYRELYER